MKIADLLQPTLRMGDSAIGNLGWACSMSSNFREVGCGEWLPYTHYHLNQDGGPHRGLDGKLRRSLCPHCRHIHENRLSGQHVNLAKEMLADLTAACCVYVCVLTLPVHSKPFVYVGCTADYERRRNQHLAGNGNIPLARALTLRGVVTRWGIVSTGIPEHMFRAERDLYDHLQQDPAVQVLNTVRPTGVPPVE